MLAVTALERGTTRPLEGTRNLFVAMEAFLRAIPWLWADRQAVFKVTPKNEVDLGGWDAVRHLRLPLTLATLTIVVLALRWTDVLLRTAGRAPLLPDVPPLALVVLTLFGVVEATIIVRFAARMWVRRQYRQLWRFPVSIPARVDGADARCVDLHQRGAAVVIDRDAVPERLGAALTTLEAGGEPPAVELALTFTLADGTEHRAVGRLDPRSVRSVGPGAVRIGGSVQWDDVASRRAVIERCYVVEPYGARRGLLQRRAPRHAMRLAARVDGHPAHTVDVSEYGAAFHLRRHDLVVGVPVDVELRLPSGRRVTGRFRPLNRAPQPRGVRVGGEMEWRDVDWIGLLADP